MMIIVQNGINDSMREAYSDVLTRLDEQKLLTEDIKLIIRNMIDTVTTNKKVTKTSKKTRLSGYHLYMREHRKVVKAEQPDITPQQMTSVLAKAWKDVPDDKKQDYNDRAKKEKNLSIEEETIGFENKTTNDIESTTSSSNDVSNDKEDVGKKKEKKKTVPKKDKLSTKKKATAKTDACETSNEISEASNIIVDEPVLEEVNESDSDIDI